MCIKAVFLHASTDKYSTLVHYFVSSTRSPHPFKVNVLNLRLPVSTQIQDLCCLQPLLPLTSSRAQHHLSEAIPAWPLI
eukprot:scaffold21749_cov49-Prasinocladus_malaysianus.AAC.4